MRYPGLMLLVFVYAVSGASASRTRARVDVKRGEQVYKTLCWSCRGNYGRGDGLPMLYPT